MITTTTSVRRRRLGRGLAAVLAAGLLLAACGGDDDGGNAGGEGGAGEPTPPTAPTTQSVEEGMAGNIVGWDPCEVLGDHLTEFVEFLDYQRFNDDLFSTNGQNTGGFKLCSGRAIYLEDPESEVGGVQGDINFGFRTASQEGDIYADEEYQTPRGAYDEFLQVRREVYDPETLAERTLDGPWEEATVLLGDTGTGTTLSAFILDTERDFVLDLSAGGLDHDGEMAWTLEEVADHFREVTMVNAYQALADRYDELN